MTYGVSRISLNIVVRWTRWERGRKGVMYREGRFAADEVAMEPEELSNMVVRRVVAAEGHGD